MRHHRQHPRGTVVALFLLLVAVLVTALISTMALTSGSQAQISTLTFKRDQAFYAAEAGMQRALWMAKYGNWAGQG
jgi:Tfp pilus assembly protein PilX